MKPDALLAIALLSLSLGFTAHAATLEEVNAEIVKANKNLQDNAAASERAKSLTEAIASLHSALEMVEKVDGLTAEQREAKSSEIMATIFWCKKMMPLDMSGQSFVVASTNKNGPAGGDNKTGSAEAKQTGPELDEIAFNRVKAYAAKNPNDLRGIILRYESVAASYPQSKWGQNSAREAAQTRSQLDAILASWRKAMGSKLQRLETADLLLLLDVDIAAETNEMKKVQLQQNKKDIENLQSICQLLITTLESRPAPPNIPLEDVGLAKKGWIKSVKKDGVFAAYESKDALAAAAPITWNDFGAKAVVRLAEKTFSMANAELVERLCMAATVVEDYIAAERLFTNLLSHEPQRLKNVATYFERAQCGYKNDAEGGARIRLAEIKELVKKRGFTDAMEQLTKLQGDLAKNSSLQTFLAEVDLYRRSVRRQYQVDDAGSPISAFERIVRKVFGGDVKLDESTGVIEVVYEFSNSEQLQDWTVVDYYDKPSKKIDWNISNGRAECAGQGTILMWKYPISNFTIMADLAYTDENHRAVIYSCMSKDTPYGVWAFCRRGEAKLNMGALNEYGWYSNARFIWRPGEVATLRFTLDPGAPYPFALTVNDKYAISGKRPASPGAIGFGFDGGRGSVDNVRIKGKLDMDAFKKLIAGVR